MKEHLVAIRLISMFKVVPYLDVQSRRNSNGKCSKELSPRYVKPGIDLKLAPLHSDSGWLTHSLQ